MELFSQRTLYRARLVGQAPFTLDLLRQARRIRALAYSASESLIRELSGQVERLEVLLTTVPSPVSPTCWPAKPGPGRAARGSSR